MEPLITIVTPIYADTAEKVNWLLETIESVRKQTLVDWEMVVVDDASPMLLRGVDDERVRWVRLAEQQGPAIARNTAAALGTAEGIIALDADDLFAENTTLAKLYTTWDKDRSKFVYGTVQVEEQGRPSQIIPLPPYEFTLSVQHPGVIPVTALHSVSAWRNAGGWKSKLRMGLEDAEYWITLGENGNCGVNIGEPILIYRKHLFSRTQTLKDAGLDMEMRETIREMHKDSFEGRYTPMCCGKGTRAIPAAPTPAQQAGAVIARASEGATKIDDGIKMQVGARGLPTDTVWMKYTGRKAATFGVRGSTTGVQYEIQGPGHEREIFALDAHAISRLGRGRDFAVGIAPPQPKAPEPAPAPQREVPEPEVGTIIREPERSPQQMQPVEVVEEFFREDRQTASSGLEELDADIQADIEMGLPDLGIPDAIMKALEADNWTLTALAYAQEGELTKIKGIGPKWEKQIIAKAQELWNL